MVKTRRLALGAGIWLFVGGIIVTETVAAQISGPSSIYRFSIPAKPLIAALVDFTSVTGVQVVRPGGAAIAGNSRAATGNLTPATAMDVLLSGSGLGYRFVSTNTIAIFPIGTQSKDQHGDDVSVITTLLTINVQGENAWGPANGFVARQSATATKTDAPLRETPQTINVVTAAQMETLKSTRLTETLRYTPGIVTEVQPSTSYFDRIRLRGFYSTNNVYLDGTQLTPSGSLAVAQSDPALLERVEILKGPASVLYGQNGAGGLINMVSKRPLGLSERSAGISLGTGRHKVGNVDINGVSQDGSISYRLAGVARVGTLNNDRSTTKRFSFAPSLTWSPTDATTWTLMAGIQRDPEGNSSSYLPIKGMILPNANGQFARNIYTCDLSFCNYDRWQAHIASDFRQHFNETLSFRQNLRLTHVNVDAQTLSPGTLQANERTMSRNALDESATTNGMSVDNTAKYEFDLGLTQNQAIAGFDYRRFASDNVAAQGTNRSLNLDLFNPSYGGLTIPTLVTRTNNKVTQEQLGLYLQNQMALDNWRLVTGLRQDWSSSRTDNRLKSTITETDGNALTGRVGLLHNFDNGITPYISYATSFEPTPGSDYFGNPFKPSEGEQWEIGVKYEPTTFNGSFTASLYDLRRQNVTTADTVHSCAVAAGLPDCGNYSVQTGEVRVRGIELEGKISLSDGLNASLGYTYMDAEVTRSNDGLEGKVPTNTPSHMASAWLDYTFDAGLIDGLTIGAGVRYVGGMYADANNTARIPAYTLADARIAYDLGGLSPELDGTKLSITATNIADRKVVGGCFSANYCDYVPRRTVVASLNFKF